MPELMSHTIAVGLSIAAIVVMAAILNVIRTDSQQGAAQMMAENVCAQVKLAAEQLQPGSQPSTAELTLPGKIGGMPYSIRASNHAITITSASANHSCIAGTPAQLSGAASGRTTRLTLSGSAIILSST